MGVWRSEVCVCVCVCEGEGGFGCAYIPHEGRAVGGELPLEGEGERIVQLQLSFCGRSRVRGHASLAI